MSFMCLSSEDAPDHLLCKIGLALHFLHDELASETTFNIFTHLSAIVLRFLFLQRHCAFQPHVWAERHRHEL